MTDIAKVKVRVGQQNATKIISSAVGTFIGIVGYAFTSGISSVSYFSYVSDYSNLSGISSVSLLSNYSSLSGISSYSNISGIATYSNFSGISSYSNISGLSTSSINISGGISKNIPYQFAPGITSFISNGRFGQILYTDIAGFPKWISQPPREAVKGISVYNKDEPISDIADTITVLRIGEGLGATLGITSFTANIDLIEVDGGEY